MRVKSFSGMVCSIAGSLEAIGDRWAFLIIRDLMFGLTRYDELQTSTGIPPNTLADRLKHLESCGIIQRRQYSEHPPRHEYTLTEKGRDLWIVTSAFLQWGDRWDVSGCGSAPVEIYDRETGRAVKLASVDAETGEQIDPKHLAVRAGPGADDLAIWRLSQKHFRNRKSG